MKKANVLCEGVEADEDGDADGLLPLSVEEGGHKDECGCHGAFGEAQEEADDHHVGKVLRGGLASDDNCPDDDRNGDKGPNGQLVKQVEADEFAGGLTEVEDACCPAAKSEDEGGKEEHERDRRRTYSPA